LIVSTELDHSIKVPAAEFCGRIQSLAGRTFERISRPGGTQRDVLRVHFAQGPSWILVRRTKQHRATNEKAVLTALEGLHGHSVPRRIGKIADWSIITDLGDMRLSLRLQAMPKAERWPIVEGVISGIFQLQDAANSFDAVRALPQIDLKPDNLLHIAKGPERTCKRYGITGHCPRPEVLLPWIGADAPRFIKGDCRAANIVFDNDGTMGWIDFEHAGLRHGCEDLAFLLCDETLSIDIEDHLNSLDRLVREARPEAPEEYLKRMCIYATLHAGMRLRVIGIELTKSGWLDYTDIMRNDLIGAHPDLAMNLARRAAILADQYPETRPLVEIYSSISDKIKEAENTP
jgi:hypothetical protein